MEQYAIDTNLFFNLEAKIGLGDKTETVIRNCTLAALNGRAKGEFTIYMPPRIVDEILSFFTDTKQVFLLDFFASVVIQSPECVKQQFDGRLISDLIEETRNRAYRGMKIGEEEIIRTAEQFMGKEHLIKKEFQLAVGKILNTYRGRFRNATRTGMIDSLADIDLVMLAKEQSAAIVSTDEGLVNWARKMGVREVPAAVFGKMMQGYL